MSVLRVAAKAVIYNERGEVLFLREAGTYEDATHVGSYEIPGGRIEDGESFYEGLIREVKEETGLEIEPVQPIYVGEWYPVIKGVEHHIIATFMICRAQSNEIILSKDHDAFVWLTQKDLPEYDILDPEDKVMEAFQDWFIGHG